MPVTNYVWLGENILYETDENDAVTVEYTYEPQQYGRLVSEYRGSTTYTHYYDALGSTLALTDGTGTVTDTFAYNAWGDEIAATGNTPTPYRWLGGFGYYWDRSPARYNIRARYYSPDIGRWLTVDPFGFIDSPNGFLYCLNNPTGFFDPSGAFCAPCPENKTKLGGLLPTNGTTDDASSTRPVGIRITTQKGPELGPCGAFKWEIAWSLRDPAPSTGAFILQHVVIEKQATDCDGNDVTEKIFGDTAHLEFWEAWPISPGRRQQADSGDRYASSPAKCTVGSVQVTGLYGLVRGNISDFPQLKEDAVRYAGGAHSTDSDPHIRMTAPPRQHAIYVYWDCCSNET